MALACKVHLTNGFEMRRGIGEEKLNVDEKIHWYCPVASSLTLAKLQICKFKLDAKFSSKSKSKLRGSTFHLLFPFQRMSDYACDANDCATNKTGIISKKRNFADLKMGIAGKREKVRLQ